MMTGRGLATPTTRLLFQDLKELRTVGIVMCEILVRQF